MHACVCVWGGVSLIRAFSQFKKKIKVFINRIDQKMYYLPIRDNGKLVHFILHTLTRYAVSSFSEEFEIKMTENLCKNVCKL